MLRHPELKLQVLFLLWQALDLCAAAFGRNLPLNYTTGSISRNYLAWVSARAAKIMASDAATLFAGLRAKEC